MKYIQRRELVDVNHGQGRGPERRGGELTAAQQDWLATTDTFYLASAAPDGSADASHRGGTPGFLEVPDANSLLWPDYAGNSMFNTLGKRLPRPEGRTASPGSAQPVPRCTSQVDAG